MSWVHQEIGSFVATIAYWVIGLPIGFVLAFGKDWGLAGIWLGLTAAIYATAVFELPIVVTTDWKKAALKARKRLGLDCDDIEA